MAPPVRLSTFALRQVPAPDYWAQVRPWVDGGDLLAGLHPGGLSSFSHRDFLGPARDRPFAATGRPRRIELSDNDCVPACCGGVFVTVRRQDDRVVWSSWENTHDSRAPLPGSLHFDAARYDGELARAAADHTWERPVDTTARLLLRAIEDSGWSERWGCVLEGVAPVQYDPLDSAGPPAVEVDFRLPGGGRGSYELPVAPHISVEEQVRAFTERVMAGDPHEAAC
ncbi:hypothetical protein [Streptomyces nitrosporeus]|uniref:hypothetical protein n=1 Tax=Streptomyces nitrosporeus TaxID=28894 RepID=UPI00331982BD